MVVKSAASQFCWHVRVYYEDTDAAGLVYYANYLKFFERCRTEWLRALGFEQQEVARREGVIFVVAQAQIDFLRPARLDDALTLTAQVRGPARASLDFEQRALRTTQGAEELLARAQVKVVCVDQRTLRPTALPPAIARLLVPSLVPS